MYEVWFEVWIWRNKEWHIVGRYGTQAEAWAIRDDYRARGEIAQVVRE